MPEFAANLYMLYPALDFLDRFAAAARQIAEGDLAVKKGACARLGIR